MGNFRELEDFEERFKTMDIAGLRRWKTYWTQHAQLLAPRIRKEAMKRVLRIDNAILRRLSEQSDA